ncbi:MAG: T9SS type A sorting domain-containing protein [bacterium]
MKTAKLFFLIAFLLLLVGINLLLLSQEPLPDTVWSKALDNVNVVKFSPDGLYVFVGVYKDIYQYEVNNGSLVKTFSGRCGKISRIEFSSTGDTIICSGGVGGAGVSVINTVSGDTLMRFNLGESSSGAEACITPDGKRIITTTGKMGLDEPQILVIDIATKEIIKTFIGRYYMAYRLDISPNGKYFSFSDYRGDSSSVILMNANTYDEISILGYHGGEIGDVKFSNDNTMIASCGHDGLVNIWDLETKDIIKTISVQGTEYRFINRISFSNDSKFIILGNDTEGNLTDVVLVYNIKSGERVYQYPYSGAISIDVSINNYIISSGFDPNPKNDTYFITYLLNSKWNGTDVKEKKDTEIKYIKKNEKLYVELPEKFSGNIDIKIYDITGKLIKSLNEQIINSDLKKIEIDIGFLSTGIYILELNISDEIYTLRFLAP